MLKWLQPKKHISVSKPPPLPPMLSPTAPRQASTQKLAQHYAQQLVMSMQQQKIAGRLVKGYIAPRYVGIGMQFAEAGGRSKLLRIAGDIALQCGVKGLVTEEEQGIFWLQFPLPSELWKAVSRLDTGIAGTNIIGLAGDGKPVRLDFSLSPHWMVTGMTNSGKSSMLRTIMCTMIETMPADQCRLFLADPNHDHDTIFTGVGHMDYEVATRPHDIVRVGQYIKQELARRMQIAAEDRKTLQPWYFVIDEGNKQELLRDPDMQTAVAAITCEGRSANIHCVLGIHDPNYRNFKPVVNEMGAKILGLVERPVASGQHGSGLQLNKLMGKGDFVFMGPGIGPLRFQAAYTPTGSIRQLPRHPVMPISSIELDEEVAGGAGFFMNTTLPTPRPVAWLLKRGTENVDHTEFVRECHLNLVEAGVNLDFAHQIELAWEEV